MSADSPAIKLYRDKFKLNLNAGRRADIESTVTDLELWELVLNSWGYYDKKGKWKTFSPLSVGKLLSEYERREKCTKRSNGTVRSEREVDERLVQVGVSKWSHRRMHPMPENQGVRFRAGSKTLEQIVAEALREQKD